MKYKVYIGFSKPKGKIFPIFSWLIRLFERTEYSHVFVRFLTKDIGDIIYQASGSQVNFMGGKYFIQKATVVDEFEFEVSESTRKKMFRWAIKESGAPYGIKQIFGIALVKIFRLKKNPFASDQKTWVCSELAGFILEEYLGTDIGVDLNIAGPRIIYERLKQL